jgi:hypothetical protein
MIQLLLHLLGDFIIQNDWMALNKKKKSWIGELACHVHCITYALPFLFIASPLSVLIIYITHYLIDRTNVIMYFLAFRNNTKKEIWKKSSYGRKYMIYDISNFGFNKIRPFAISIWLFFIVDNCFHIAINYFVIKYIG